MNKTDILNKVSRSFHKMGFEIKKHSPEILAAAGVVGTIASGIMACKATTKVNDILEEAKENINDIHMVSMAAGFEELPESIDSNELKRIKALAKQESVQTYTSDDAKKNLAITYAKTGLKFVKLYAPSVVLGTFSLGCLLTSNNILRKRNVALAAAYATVDKGFKEYRNRVVERFGKEVDQELRYNVKAKEIEKTVVDENGKEKTVKETVNVIDPSVVKDDFNMFLFDETNPNYQKGEDYNFMFLRAQQSYFNNLLIARGHVFLNEVLDRLGIDRTKAGNVVGWVYDPTDESRDNYIDFGMFDYTDQNKRNFLDGDERSIMLTFNVDGYILDSAFNKKGR